VRLLKLGEYQHPRVQVCELDPRLLAALGALSREAVRQELVDQELALRLVASGDEQGCGCVVHRHSSLS
jgi:hypothetical protein